MQVIYIEQGSGGEKKVPSDIIPTVLNSPNSIASICQVCWLYIGHAGHLNEIYCHSLAFSRTDGQ